MSILHRNHFLIIFLQQLCHWRIMKMIISKEILSVYSLNNETSIHFPVVIVTIVYAEKQQNVK